MREPSASRLTRRSLLKGTGAAGVGAFLAGCTGDGASDGTQTSETGGSGTTTETTAAESTATETGGGHSVSMSPVGTVVFDAVPEEVFTVFPQYADMAVALGHGDAVNSVYVPEMSGTTMNHYNHHLDGVSFDWKGLHDPLSNGFSKELLYKLGSDVHLTDPAWATTQSNWDRSDVEEIGSQIAPWFGNFYSGTHSPAPDGYGNYQYYDLWELFGKVAAVFRERERYEALAEVHSNLVSSIREKLPPKEERPSVVRVTLAQDGQSFYTYHLNKPGYWLADTRPLGANDAFADEDWQNLWGTVDYETMLKADPDVILHLWGITPRYSMADTRSKLENHSSGSQLTAVQNDRVYAAGMRYQGPIMNLFQIEMGAKQLYPDLFGEWPRYEDGDHYPEIPEDEWLFDRNEVADIVTGGGR
ncbi:ABC transporter substrate-binding protein [Halorussus gelatinilyticus]|uniref:ABC transporter substrate-binding protein n=1 Tax=Halorussus gelatinilyticus TaxID=2937524 RepID=A0A8U0IKX1_9EURY|nr:ABC transporter substrate-binding protein [Halorussus gelatinilyticus]UPW01763.1 ABC transporter substrate-binding protein [Halorussus gelatinilyticus]